MRDLETIEAALKRRDQLTKKEVNQLEWTRDSMLSPLVHEAKRAFARNDDEVGMALIQAYLEKFDRGIAEAECVVYCRVSGERQAHKGSGLWRQLETCLDYAKRNNYAVVAVFSEIASGADELPVRATVQRMAEKRHCRVLCEDYDRWSRKGISDIPPAYVEMTSEAVTHFKEQVKDLFKMHGLRAIKGGAA